DRQDPLFRFFEVLVGTEITRRPFSARPKLNSILDEAARRGDEATAQKVRQALKRIDSAPTPLPPMPFPPSPFMPEFDEPDEFDAMPDLGQALPNLPPEAMGDLAGLLTILSVLPESGKANARKTRPKDMPV